LEYCDVGARPPAKLTETFRPLLSRAGVMDGPSPFQVSATKTCLWMFINTSCNIKISISSIVYQACYIEISFWELNMWSSSRGPCVQAPRLLPKLLIRYCHGCALLPSSHSLRVVSNLELPTLRIVSSSIHLEPIAIAAALSAALRFGRTFFLSLSVGSVAQGFP
jgi:hypothetical protein